MLRLTTLFLMAFLNVSYSNDWGAIATISSTMGVQGGRLCLGEESRGDIGCPPYAPSLTTSGDVSITGNLSSIKFIGDGSLLTNLPAGGSMPSGAIIGFDRTSCPAGWSEYAPAYGRFLRGIDKGAGNDPSGTRTAGNVQDDTNKSHYHNGTANSAGAHTHTIERRGGNGSTSTMDIGTWATSSWASAASELRTASAGAHTHTLSIDAVGAAEARPKNVAVLYCRKD